MSLQLSKIQIEVMNMLLDMYENSVTYKGQNIKNQTFAISPEKVFCDYNGDYTDQDDVDYFNIEMRTLMDFEYVILTYIKGTTLHKKDKLEIWISECKNKGTRCIGSFTSSRKRDDN